MVGNRALCHASAAGMGELEYAAMPKLIRKVERSKMEKRNDDRMEMGHSTGNF